MLFVERQSDGADRERDRIQGRCQQQSNVSEHLSLRLGGDIASALKRDVFERVDTVRRSLPRMALVMSIQ